MRVIVVGGGIGGLAAADWIAPRRHDVVVLERAILRNDVYYLDPLRRWSEGRVVLLGDAAHATTPGLGQGAAQAIEDAVVLAGALANGDELAGALTVYESIRRPRTDAVLKLSRRADKTAQLASPLGSRLRNAIVRRMPERAQHRQLEPLVRYEPQRHSRWPPNGYAEAPVRPGAVWISPYMSSALAAPPSGRRSSPAC